MWQEEQTPKSPSMFRYMVWHNQINISQNSNLHSKGDLFHEHLHDKPWERIIHYPKPHCCFHSCTQLGPGGIRLHRFKLTAQASIEIFHPDAPNYYPVQQVSPKSNLYFHAKQSRSKSSFDPFPFTSGIRPIRQSHNELGK